MTWLIILKIVQLVKHLLKNSKCIKWNKTEIKNKCRINDQKELFNLFDDLLERILNSSNSDNNSSSSNNNNSNNNNVNVNDNDSENENGNDNDSEDENDDMLKKSFDCLDEIINKTLANKIIQKGKKYKWVLLEWS